MEREANGRWVKGQSANPKGRPSKTREARFLEITLQTVTFEDWAQIVGKAKEQAKRGDPIARKWLGDYLQGPPVQRHEMTGADGGPIQTQETPPDFSKLSDDELEAYLAICEKLQIGEG